MESKQPKSKEPTNGSSSPGQSGPPRKMTLAQMPQVLEVLAQTGTYSKAAATFHVSPHTMSRYCKRYPEYAPQIADALMAGHAYAVELAEMNIMEAIGHSDDANLRVKSSQWWLTNSPAGKAKGYGQRSELVAGAAFDPASVAPERPTSWAQVREQYEELAGKLQTVSIDAPEEVPLDPPILGEAQ
jgi:hypothetical protein